MNNILPIIHFHQGNIVCPNAQKSSPFFHRVMALEEDKHNGTHLSGENTNRSEGLNFL